MSSAPNEHGSAQPSLTTANAELFQLLAAELRKLAQLAMRGERPDHTLQPTALVNEAFLRLTARSISWQSRAHFLAVAATVMRQILIDHARARQARKRGGALLRAELLDPVGLVHSDPSRFLIIEQLIRRLGEFDRRAERLVELRYFTGCTLDEAARSLGVSPKTAHRDWEFARAWLEQQLRQSP